MNKPLAPQIPNIEQTLAHLDQLRQNCKQTSFFSQETMQQALQQIQLTSSESLKTKYSDLFSLAEDVDESRNMHIKPRSHRKTPSTKVSKAKQTVINCSDISDDSSEDEPKPIKKRKRAAQVESDSD